MRTARRMPSASIRFPVREERGPNGRRLCRVCGTEVPRGRRTLCSPKCQATILEHVNWRRRRRVIYTRDKARCQLCGMDIGRLERILKRVTCRVRTWVKRAMGFPLHLSLYQCDHIVPLSEGGGWDDDNLRTLCYPCHQSETRRLHQRLAARRRNERHADHLRH